MNPLPRYLIERTLAGDTGGDPTGLYAGAGPGGGNAGVVRRGFGRIGALSPSMGVGVIGRLINAPQGTMLGIERRPNGRIDLWSQVKDSAFIIANHDRTTDPAGRFSWRNTYFVNLRKVWPLRDLTLSGTWAQLNTSGDGAAEASHVGDRAAQATVNGAYAQVEVSRAGGKPYDVWIVYTARTSGAFVRPDIDGSQALVSADVGDAGGLGYKNFTTVGAVDLTRRQYQRVARDLTGTHMVRATKAANAAGGNFIIEAVVVSADLMDDRILPPQWQPSTAYTLGDEVQLNGVFYSARATGTSGAGAGPTHTTGIASDGAMDWNSALSPTYHLRTQIDYAAEREYAVEATIGGVVKDIGGQTHGEALISRAITIDGVAWSEGGPFGITTGQNIVMVEATTWVHPSAANLASCVLTRTYTPSKVRFDVSATGVAASDLGFFYVGMLPAVSWDGLSGKRIFDRMIFSTGQEVNLDAYANQSAATLSINGALGVAALGSVEGFSLGYASQTTLAAVNGYANPSGNYHLIPNGSGVGASGGTDWTFKGYFRRASRGNPEAFAPGQTINFTAEHAFGPVA